jgi:FAD:protein FMN transferase
MKKIIIILLLLTAFIFSGCNGDVVYISKNEFLLDTIINIKIYHYENKKQDESVIDESFKLIKNLEDKLSIHVKNSDLDDLKINAGKTPVEVDDVTYEIIEKSIEYSKTSSGLFDISSGPLIDLWAIDPPNGYLPTKLELEKVLPLISYERIKLYDDNMIMLADEGMIANLGAIAKGAITDKVKDYLTSEGIKSAIINSGGNVLLIGEKPDGRPFSIGIQDPNDLRGAYLMALNLKDKAVVSSGDYERFFEINGKIYHHILDPFSGYPAKTNIKQVSIIADNSTEADALSTTVLLMGLKDGIRLIESLSDVEAIFITKDNKIYITDDLSGLITKNDELLANYQIVTNKEDLY